VIALSGASYLVVSGKTSEVGTGDSAGRLVGDAEADASELGIGVADGSDAGVDDAPPAGGETSGCFPERGSVSNPHSSPAALSVRP
jgi:hypothetical protein